MNRPYFRLPALLSLLVALPWMAAGNNAWASPSTCEAGAQAVDFSILHTNDLHSSFAGAAHHAYFTPETGDNDPVQGHYGRLAYLIQSLKQEKAVQNEPTLLVDAGDFYAGTAYQILAPNPAYPSAPELAFFSRVGYDAVTLGNHEFDAGPTGFANMLMKNETFGLHVPLVAANLVFPDTLSSSPLTQASEQIQPFLLKTLDNGQNAITVGIVGLFGPNAAKASKTNRLGIGAVGFDDASSKEKMDQFINFAQEQVSLLKDEQGAELVVVLIHGGNPEDTTVAQQVDGVDVVIGGHTHEAYEQVRVQDGVYIAQTGHDAHNLGVLEFSYRCGQLELRNQEHVLRPVDDSVPVDDAYMPELNGYTETVNESFLANTGYELDSPIYVADVDMVRENETRNPLGTFVASELLAELTRNQTAPSASDVYLTSLAMIRTDIDRIDGSPTLYQFSDVFQMLPLGFDDAFAPGYPVVSFYLSKRELRQLIDLMDIYRKIEPLFTTVYSDSLSFEIRPWGIPFVNRIKNLRLHGVEYRNWPNLIKISTNSNIANYVYLLKSLTYGALNIQPKDRNGNHIDTPLSENNLREYTLFARSVEGRVIAAP